MALSIVLMPISAALVSTFVLAQAVLASTPLAVRITSDVADCPSSVKVQSALRQALGDGERSAGGCSPMAAILLRQRQSAMPAC
jgi:hypothetical protein